MSFLTSTIGKVLAAAIAIILLLGFLQLRSCQQARQRAAQSRVDRAQQEALQNSAADAVNTVSGVATNDMATADLGRRNREEITNAEGASERVSDAATAAGRNSLCRRAAYRNRPECWVQ